MSNLGSRLKQAREARGIDLREIAAATKISVTALEALERNDYSRLPGGIFSRSFVRAYALAVDLDPEITVDEFVAALEQSRRDAEQNARKPEISADDRAFLARQQRALKQLRVGAAIVVVLVAAAAIWWFWGRGAADPGRPLEERSPAAPAASSPSPDPSAPPPVAPATPATEAGRPAPADRVAIEFDFLARCWISITADGVLDVRRQFEAGERHAVEARTEVVISAGNAGGFRWSINGRAARPLGRAGATREVRISPQNYTTFLEQVSRRAVPAAGAPLRAHLGQPVHVDGRALTLFVGAHRFEEHHRALQIAVNRLARGAEVQLPDFVERIHGGPSAARHLEPVARDRDGQDARAAAGQRGGDRLAAIRVGEAEEAAAAASAADLS